MPSNLFKDDAFTLSAVDKIALDPEKGCANDISWWAKLYFDGQIFPWQHVFYHHPAKDKMVVAGVRVGKSRGATYGMLHFGQFHPYARILNTSISSEQAKIVYHNMLEVCTLPRFKHWVERIEKSPYPMIRLINGAEFWFRSIGYEAELIRGFEFDLIHVDEAAYVTSEMAVNTLRGRLLGVNPITRQPRAGVMWYSTSPKGKQGWLYERWKRGDSRFPGADPQRYLSLRVRTVDNPLLSQETLQEIMAEYSERMIAQELEGEFLDSNTAEFNLEQILALCDDQDPIVRQLLEGVEEWRKSQGNRKSLRKDLGLAEELDRFEIPPKPGRRYLASWDLGKKATKAGRNATVGMVFDITELPWRLVAYRYEQGMGYLPAKEWIEDLHRRYSSLGVECYTVIDASGKGDVLNEIIEAENRFSVDGIVYNTVLKPNLLTAAKIAIERGLVRYPLIKRMVDQLALYEQNDKDLAQDIVMSFAQAMFKARELTGLAGVKPHTAAASLYRAPMTLDPRIARMAALRRERLHTRTGRA